jgi:hypothetical protein
VSIVPEQHDGHAVDPSEATASPDDRWWIAAVFVAFLLVAAILFTVYVLAWDGGAHT